MILTETEPNIGQRVIRRLAWVRPISWGLARILPPIDRWVIRWSRGRISATTLFTGLPLVLLTTTGAKSGRPRHTPLTPTPDGDSLILIASNFGQRHDPAWYYNLRANPEVTVTYRGRSHPYIAQELTGLEWDRAWDKAVVSYPGYQAYRSRAGRVIPVIRLNSVSSEP
jgi:deazaflavin-dependent oxidoreductase (nitroreductase family)